MNVNSVLRKTCAVLKGWLIYLHSSEWANVPLEEVFQSDKSCAGFWIMLCCDLHNVQWQTVTASPRPYWSGTGLYLYSLVMPITVSACVITQHGQCVRHACYLGRKNAVSTVTVNVLTSPTGIACVCDAHCVVWKHWDAGSILGDYWVICHNWLIFQLSEKWNLIFKLLK